LTSPAVRDRSHALGKSRATTSRWRGRVEYTYDPLTFRLESFKTTRTGGDKLQHVFYYYDAVGNIVETDDDATQSVYFSESVPAADQDFTYDAVYRLIDATGREHDHVNTLSEHADFEPADYFVPDTSDPNGMRTYERVYAYDAVGNLTSMQHLAGPSNSDGWTRDYSYVTDTNQLEETDLGSSPIFYSHDEHGNMVGMPHLDGLGYDYADQLRHVDKQTDHDVWFVYDASGQRVRKVYEHDNLRDETIYLGGYEIYRRTIISTESLDTERQTLHVSDDARRVCMIESLTWEGEEELTTPVTRFRFQLDNHLGTACVETDENGAVISYEEYHPYGTSSYRAMKSGVEVSAKRYRYTGKERDEETSLYYHGARYYAPWLGRWVAADPAGLVDGCGLYSYCRGSPINLNDPSGMRPPDPSDPVEQEQFANPALARGEYLKERGITARQLEQERLAAAHGQTEGRLETIQNEIGELQQSQRARQPIQPWNIEHFTPEKALKERFTGLKEAIEGGVAEQGEGGKYHSTILRQAIESGLVSSEAELSQFAQKAESARQRVITGWATWRAVERLSLLPGGQGAAAFAKAPVETPSVIARLNKEAQAAGVAGEWKNVPGGRHSNSLTALGYQKQISGVEAGTEFYHAGVAFDALDTGKRTLQEAKDKYAQFVDKTSGEFSKRFVAWGGTKSLVNQAKSQLGAAQGLKLEWVFSEQATMNAVKKLFAAEGITGISFRWIPRK
jgi:RHS repeat-associated protein